MKRLIAVAVSCLAVACSTTSESTAPPVEDTATQVVDSESATVETGQDDLTTAPLEATSPVESSTTTSSTTTTSGTTTTSSSTTTSSTTTTEPRPTTTPYVIPVANASAAGWGDTHATYPATDIFENGCGNGIVSPVNGTVLEVRRVNSYDPAVDNPATRGGRSVSILGDDGVRYYLAHFEVIVESLEPGQRVDAGQDLGTIGTTGRSSACHVHFGISPPCSGKEWSVRRGVVWPHTYLNDWRNGGQLSPVAEVAQFSADRPDACADAEADPNAPDS